MELSLQAIDKVRDLCIQQAVEAIEEVGGTPYLYVMVSPEGVTDPNVSLLKGLWPHVNDQGFIVLNVSAQATNCTFTVAGGFVQFNARSGGEAGIVSFPSSNVLGIHVKGDQVAVWSNPLPYINTPEPEEKTREEKKPFLKVVK